MKKVVRYLVGRKRVVWKFGWQEGNAAGGLNRLWAGQLTASGGLPPEPEAPDFGGLNEGSISYRGSVVDSYRAPYESPQPSPVKQQPLPEGWVEVEDDGGRVYFFHEPSGETTWNRPRQRFVSTRL